MDTTIWKVRPREGGDFDEKIIFTTPRLPAAVSREVVRYESNVILHITDPHFAIAPNRSQHIWRLESEAAGNVSTMTTAVTTALRQRKIGLVVVTGDLTFTGA